MKRHVLLLLLSALLLWGLWVAAAAFLDARHWLPDADRLVEYSAVALAVCLLPTAATLAWGSWALSQGPHQQLLMVVGGTGLRMLAVLGLGLAVYGLSPRFQQNAFWICILVCYLALLALEMALLLYRRPAERAAENVGPVP